MENKSYRNEIGIPNGWSKVKDQNQKLFSMAVGFLVIVEMLKKKEKRNWFEAGIWVTGKRQSIFGFF